MAVFMLNDCKFGDCGRTFPSLGELIRHIEDAHIDFDPLVVEKKEASQPTCLPLSYVLRCFEDSTKKDDRSVNVDVRRELSSIVKPCSVRSDTPPGSELDDEDATSRSENSDDSWCAAEWFSAEFILRHGARINPDAAGGRPNCDKPFACPVPGCKKRYKNVNGIKYHSKNGHKNDRKIRKGYKCRCGKSYKTARRLRNHSAVHDSSRPPSPLRPASSQSFKPLSSPVRKALRGRVASSQSRPVDETNGSRERDGDLIADENVLDFYARSKDDALFDYIRRCRFEGSTDAPPTSKDPEELRTGAPISFVSPVKEAPSRFQSASDGYVFQSAPGILTPAPSPVAASNEKLAVANRTKGVHTALSPTIKSPAIPLFHSRSIGDSHNRFVIPNKILLH